MKSYKIITLLFVYIVWTISVNFAPMGTSSSTLPWTREKAEHLARATLFYAGSGMIDSLYAAGSASAAVDILFPDAVGPDRTKYDAAINTFTSTGFNWDSQLNVTKLYQMKYVLDPYEAKRKLFSLFEDIYSSNQSSAISFKDVADEHELLYSKMFGNYQVLVKRLLNNNGMPGDYAEGTFLNLFNQENPRFPNENYARELMQLFMMGEYEPFKNKESNDTRNYEESDVRSLARILTGLMTDKMTHMTSYNANFHYTGSLQTFLTGALPMSYVPPFYSMSSGTIDPVLIAQPYNGNNGLTDNVIEYIFAKRSPQIALFLANRLYRFYINDTPTRGELDAIAAIILANNFEMLPSIKSMLALDLMYSESAMNSLKYKNPLELYVGTIKKFR